MWDYDSNTKKISNQLGKFLSIDVNKEIMHTDEQFAIFPWTIMETPQPTPQPTPKKETSSFLNVKTISIGVGVIVFILILFILLSLRKNRNLL
jgi:hypothetical protein